MLETVSIQEAIAKVIAITGRIDVVNNVLVSLHWKKFQLLK
jgi:hypothetical protein